MKSLPTLRITNRTRNSVLCTHATPATTPETRSVGLIGHTQAEFQPGAGLFFPECNAIHTVQMGFPIDVLFIDTLRMQVIKKVYAAPGCQFNTLIPAELCATLELPAGTIDATGTQVGDQLDIMSSAHASQAELNRIGAL